MKEIESCSKLETAKESKVNAETISWKEEEISKEDASREKSEKAPRELVLRELYNLIDFRKSNPKEGSYTNYLFDKGVDKILKKVGEEAAEVIIAAKNNSNEELQYEIADLFYHVFVLMAQQNLDLDNIFAELEKRRK